MKYVSEIRLNGNIEKSVRVKPYGGVSITVSDTGSSKSYKLNGQDDIPDIGIIGCGYDEDSNLLLASHSKHEVELWNHIDIVEYTLPGVNARDALNVGANDLVINSAENNLVVEGTNAVIYAKFGPGVAVMSLFEALLSYCKSCNANILKFHRLLFGPTIFNEYTVITLRQREEDKRFFMKMYLSMRGEK